MASPKQMAQTHIRMMHNKGGSHGEFVQEKVTPAPNSNKGRKCQYIQYSCTECSYVSEQNIVFVREF